MGLAPSTVEAVRRFLQSPAVVPRKVSDWEEGQLMAMISSVKNPPHGSFQVTKWEMLQLLGTEHLLEWDQIFALLREDSELNAGKGPSVSTLEVASLCILANSRLDAHSKLTTLLSLFDWDDAKAFAEADLVLTAQTTISVLRKGMRKLVSRGGPMVAKITKGLLVDSTQLEVELPTPTKIREACLELLHASTEGRMSTSSPQQLLSAISEDLEGFRCVLDMISISESRPSSREDASETTDDGEEVAAVGAVSAETPTLPSHSMVTLSTEASMKIEFFQEWLSHRKSELPKNQPTRIELGRSELWRPARCWLQYALDARQSPHGNEDGGRTSRTAVNTLTTLEGQLRLAWLYRSAVISTLKQQLDAVVDYPSGAALVCVEVLGSLERDVISAEGNAVALLRGALATLSEEATSLWRRLSESYRGDAHARNKKLSLLLSGVVEVCKVVAEEASADELLVETARAVLDAALLRRAAVDTPLQQSTPTREADEARARGLDLAVAKLEDLLHRVADDTTGASLSKWIRADIEAVSPHTGGYQCNVRRRVVQTFMRLRADEKTVLEGVLAAIKVLGDEVRRKQESKAGNVGQSDDHLSQKIETACLTVFTECSLDAALDEASTASLSISAASAFGFGSDAFSMNPFKVVDVLREMLTRMESLAGLGLEDAVAKMKSFELDGDRSAPGHADRGKKFTIRAKQAACANGWPSSEGFEEVLESLSRRPPKTADVKKAIVDDLVDVLRGHSGEDPVVVARRHCHRRLCRAHRVVYELLALGLLAEPLNPIADSRLAAAIPPPFRGAGSPTVIFDSARRVRCGRHAQMAWFVGALNVSALLENERLGRPLEAVSVSRRAGEAKLLQALCERKLMELLGGLTELVEEMQDCKIAALEQYIEDCFTQDLGRSEVLSPDVTRKVRQMSSSGRGIEEVECPPELHTWGREAFDAIQGPEGFPRGRAVATALCPSDDDQTFREFGTALRWWVTALSRQLELALVFAEAGLEREGSEQGELEETFKGKVSDAVLRYMEMGTLRTSVMKRAAEADVDRLVEIAIAQVQYSLETISAQDAEYLDAEEIGRLQRDMHRSFEAGVESNGERLIRRAIAGQTDGQEGPFIAADTVQQVLDGRRAHVDTAVSRVLGEVDEVPCALREDPFDAEVARWIGSMAVLEAARESLGVIPLSGSRSVLSMQSTNT